jgi:hypothetical protein
MAPLLHAARCACKSLVLLLLLASLYLLARPKLPASYGLHFVLQDTPEKVFEETREMTDGLNSSVSSTSISSSGSGSCNYS